MTSKKPRLILRPVVDEQIRIYTDLAKGEFGALGLVEQIGGDFVVTELFLTTQICTSSSTELDPIALGNLMCELAERGKDASALTFWIHSHGGLPAFWSATDDRTIDELQFASYSISLVVNKAGERRARFDLFQPVRITLDDLAIEVRSATPGLLESCREEFASKVDEQRTPFLLKHPGRPRSVESDFPLQHWSSDDFEDPGPFTQIEELEQQFTDGEMGWDEYCSRLRALGVANES